MSPSFCFFFRARIAAMCPVASARLSLSGTKRGASPVTPPLWRTMEPAQMAITVRELVEIPHLATRVLAGRSGLDREIRWAHACEMPAPWEWLGEGDLLLTSGLSFPGKPAAQ